MTDDLSLAIRGILVDDLEVDADQITPDALLDSLELDSLAAVELITLLQEQFGVDISAEESRLGKMTFAELVELVQSGVGVA
ncbi:phosphopantetheine-binding protein [Kitasatospora sp. NPDC096077]|uniref:phosphopantetheine-binding protein n=1 Tax=unclassified Kitasatospora TaxID=2633591 RepID=UPI00331C7185